MDETKPQIIHAIRRIPSAQKVDTCAEALHQFPAAAARGQTQGTKAYVMRQLLWGAKHL